MRDEFVLIQQLLAQRPPVTRPVVVDAGDDAAVVSMAPGYQVVISSDTMVETVHFLRATMRPADIGWKLMAANLSDMAAMGATPTFALLSLAVPSNWSESELVEIYKGLYQLAAKHEVTLVGGDTVSSPHTLVLTLTILGEVRAGRALRRSTAEKGDIVFVTGTLGDSAAGLNILLHHDEERSELHPKLLQAHRRPHPCVTLGKWLAASGERIALNDISDGISQEAWEIADASGVHLLLEQDKLPLSKEVIAYADQMQMDPYEWALHGGEDFQLLGTAPATWFQRKAASAPTPMIPIGYVESGRGSEVEIVRSGEREQLTRAGYNHGRKR
ncbi:thiamine-phosphate kinase [Mechercharimyces sp. CAU 1602]|uniref:thiamine-phosphate kinase n=1 Tax=Mechercharimyces sp. CAU 1602 TaxID=2973933 RepID=UPI00216242B1|nr:thiamine-phosphate kinase [Mechercharimyces sp. CAU 1602]MCS1352127.1 thiamine-phosphate kinase [Mechercharimyces sp. CAU 1602]